MGKLVNQGELAEILGKSDVTIWELQKEGLPILTRGARGEENVYDTAEVVAWLVESALARAGKSKARLEVELLELEVAEKRAAQALREGSLVPADQVAPAWQARVLAAAVYMSSRASRLAAQLADASSLEARRNILRAADAQFLSELGAAGEELQAEVDSFLGRMPANEVHALRKSLERVSSGQQP